MPVMIVKGGFNGAACRTSCGYPVNRSSGARTGAGCGTPPLPRMLILRRNGRRPVPRIFRDGGGVRPALVAPAATTSLPGPGQAFRDKSVADRGSFSQYDPQLSAVAIFVAGAARERKRPSVEKREQTIFCCFSEPVFSRASRWAYFGCVDVGNSDLLTAKPEGIPIDNAVRSRRTAADRESG
jgi:hypothetical protein